MNILPEYSFSIINGFTFMIPMLLIRFGLASLLNHNSLQKLNYFPEVVGGERFALKVYFITNTFLIFSPAFNPVRFVSPLKYVGLVVYFCGLLLFAMSILSFCKEEIFVCKGIYKISRNPMYVGYFGIFLGISLLIGSLLHLVITFIYQISVHFLILSEERWCHKAFGESYDRYVKNVPRYLLFK